MTNQDLGAWIVDQDVFRRWCVLYETRALPVLFSFPGGWAPDAHRGTMPAGTWAVAGRVNPRQVVPDAAASGMMEALLWCLDEEMPPGGVLTRNQRGDWTLRLLDGRYAYSDDHVTDARALACLLRAVVDNTEARTGRGE